MRRAGDEEGVAIGEVRGFERGGCSGVAGVREGLLVGRGRDSRGSAVSGGRRIERGG